MGESIGLSLSNILPKERTRVNFNPYDNVIFEGTPEEALQHPHPWLRGPVSVVPSEYSDPRNRPSQYQTIPIPEAPFFQEFSNPNPVSQISTVNPFVTDTLFNPYQNISAAPLSSPRILRSYSPRYSTIGHYSPRRISMPQRALSPHIHSYAANTPEFPAVDPYTTNAPSYTHLVEPTFATNFPSIIPESNQIQIVNSQENPIINQAPQIIQAPQISNITTGAPFVEGQNITDVNSSNHLISNTSVLQASGPAIFHQNPSSQMQRVFNVPTYSLPNQALQNFSYPANYSMQIASNTQGLNQTSFYSYPYAQRYNGQLIQPQNSMVQTQNIRNLSTMPLVSHPSNLSNSLVYPGMANPQEAQAQVYRTESFGAPSQIYAVNPQPIPLPSFGPQILNNEVNSKNMLNASLMSNSVNLGKVEFQGPLVPNVQLLSSSMDDSLPLEEPAYAKKSYFGSDRK